MKEHSEAAYREAIKGLDPTKLDSVHDAWIEIYCNTAIETMSREEQIRSIRFRAKKRRLDLYENQGKESKAVSKVPLRQPGTPLAYLERYEREQGVHDALSTLPEQDQEAIKMSFFEDLPLKSLAEHFGCSVPSAHRRRDRAIQHLKPNLSHLQRSYE
jgi:RNA polymerase sigma factor (sigma-70 family)